MAKKSKFGLKHYFQPTPKRIRILGDSMAAASTLAATITVLGGHPVVGTVMIIAGWMGKFISNFFTDEVEAKQDNQNLNPNE